MAVKNSKDTIVDMKTGVMKVNGGTGVDIVTVKAQGLTFKTNGSIKGEEEYIDPDTNITSTVKVKSYCVPAEDVVSMWLANEQGTDARLVILEDSDDDTDSDISGIKHVTSGDASWKKDHIVMGGMTFTPSEECTNVGAVRRRKLLEVNNIDGGIDMPSFDSITIHRALKQRVNVLSGRRLAMAPAPASAIVENEYAIQATQPPLNAATEPPIAATQVPKKELPAAATQPPLNAAMQPPLNAAMPAAATQP
jgi:hypothetical protein